MNETIINNINTCVKESDDLYIIGDFAFSDKKRTNELLSKIRCKNIYLIMGNHDGFMHDKNDVDIPVKWLKSYHEIKYNGYKFILFHYPIAVWNVKHFGSIHLYGHIHSQSFDRGLPEEMMINAFNMNCELHDYKPVSIDTIISWHNPTANLIKERNNMSDQACREMTYEELIANGSREQDALIIIGEREQNKKLREQINLLEEQIHEERVDKEIQLNIAYKALQLIVDDRNRLIPLLGRPTIDSLVKQAKQELGYCSL